MKLLKLFIFLVIANNCFSQGNLIHNAGFEDGDNSAVPTEASQADDMQVWEDDIQTPNCTITKIHSPDWYHTGNYKMVTSPGNNTINARNGNCYVGMGSGEMIEQNLFNTNPMLNNKEYEASLYFQFPGLCNTWNGGTILSGISFPPTSDVHLKVFISTNKIKYVGEPGCNDLSDWLSDGDFCNFKHAFNDIVEVADFTLNSTSYPLSAWHRLNARFTVPNNNKNYEWIAFEVQCSAGNNGSGKYIIMDDMSLIRACELGCTNVSNGPPNPSIASYVVTGPKCMGAVVNNIQNVETVKIEVFSGLGSVIRTQQFSNNNGFTGPVFWDGLTDAFSSAAAGLYVLRVTCTNACGTFTFGSQVFNPGCGNSAVETNPPPSVTSADIKIFDCCELTTVLTNKAFGPGPAFSPTLWHYRPRNTITMSSCTVQANRSKMELIAGETIELLATTSIDPGTNEFQAFTTPCADARLVNPLVSENGNDQIPDMVQPVITDNTIKNNKSVQAVYIVPNPSNDGRFELLNINAVENLTIEIYSSTGVLVKTLLKSKVIDISELDKGLYIIEIYIENQKTIKKIIYL